MSIRLNKATRNLNQSMTVLTRYLNEMGFAVEVNPNTKLTEEQYSLLVAHFNEGKENTSSVEESENHTDLGDIHNQSQMQFEFDKFRLSIADLSIIEQIRLINKITKPLRIKVSRTYLFSHLKKNDYEDIEELINKIPEILINENSLFYSISKTNVNRQQNHKIEIINQYRYLVFLTKKLLDSQLLDDIESHYSIYEPKDYKTELTAIKEFEVLNKIFDFHFEDLFHRIYLLFVGQLIKNITYSYVEFSDKIHFAQEITHETRSEYLVEYLGILGVKNKNSLFLDYLSMNYDKIHPSQKLRLWLYDIFGEFNYELFYPYFFILSNAEKKILKKKGQIVMKDMVWNDILHSREPWIFVSDTIENNQTYKIYHATWKSIWFDEKTISFCIDDKPSFSLPFSWEMSEDKFNLIIGSLSGKKIKPLTIHIVDNQISEIDGLQEIEEAIWKILIKHELAKNSECQHTYLKNISDISKLPENIIAKNKCVELLSHYQSNDIPIVLVVRMSAKLKEIEQSLLSCIQINKYEFAVVWESLEYEKSKRTHIFKCDLKEIEEFISYIKAYIMSELHLRRRLNSDDVMDNDFRIKLKYLTGINHDNANFEIWKTRFFQLFPELKKIRR